MESPIKFLAIFFTLAHLLFACPEQDAARSRTTTLNSLFLRASSEEMSAGLHGGKAFALIKFQKGEARRPEFRPDPLEDSPYTFDTVLVDRNGEILVLQIGGDNLIDRSWFSMINQNRETSTLRERHEDVLLGLELLDRLELDRQISQKFHWEIQALRGTLEHTLRDVSFSGPQNLRPDTMPSTNELSSLAYDVDFIDRPDASLPKNDGLYVHEVFIRASPCCWEDVEHSAVEVRSYDAGHNWVDTVVTANHGRLADHKSMSATAGCPKIWEGRPNKMPVVQPYYLTDTFWVGDAGGCSTPYGSGWVFEGRHVCNDDSLAQFYNVKGNALATWVTCGDDFLRAFAPNCYYD